MADLLGSMRVEIVGDNTKLDKSIKTSQKNTEDFGKKTTSLGKSLSGLFAGIGFAVVAKKLFDLGKQAENLFKVQELAETKLDQTLVATAHAAGLTADQLKEMATGLQDVTTFGDEAIIGAESLLLTFKDIGGDVFPRALESILDVSVAMGQDLKSSTVQLGKALNDPVGGIAALTRVGIQFTDEQKNLIKSLTDTGDVAGAQSVILEELESQFGGVARAVSETSDGISQQLNNSYGDLLETIGSVISEGLIPYRKNLKLEVESVNSSIQAHILRKKALEGNAELIELLTLRQIEQEKTESKLAQAVLNIEEAESQVLDTRHLSEVQIRQITAAKQAAIEKAQQLVISLEGEVEAATRATAATERQVVEERNRVQANILLAQGIVATTETTNENTEANDENTEAVFRNVNAIRDYEEQLSEATFAHRTFTEDIIDDNDDIGESEEALQQRRLAAIQGVANQISSIMNQRVINARAAMEEFLSINGAEIESLEAKAETEEGLNTAEQARLDLLNEQKRALAEEQYNREVEAFKTNKVLKIAETIQTGAQAAVSAFSALAGIPIIGPILGGVAAAAVGTLTGVQVGLISAQNPPPKPQFADGGIVPGGQFTGDRVPILADSGEMIINRGDQQSLLNFLQNGSQSQNNTSNIRVVVNLDKKPILDVVSKATKNGTMIIDSRSVK